MEFEKPEIFSNNESLEIEHNKLLSKFKSDLENRQIEPMYRSVSPRLNDDVYELPFIPNSNLDSSKKYIGIKNIKLINEISKYLIATLYTSSFRTERPKIFLLLEEILVYIESSPQRLECYITYKNEIKLDLYKRLDKRFINYIFSMVDVNLNEYRKLY